MTALPTTAAAAMEFGVPPMRRDPAPLDFAQEGEHGVRGLRFLSADGDSLAFDIDTADVGPLIGVNGVTIRGIQGCKKDLSL